MNSERQAILSLIASGRITAAEGERLIAISSESRETAWMVSLCLLAACLAQIHVQEFTKGVMQFLNTQLPALAQAVHQALSPLTNSIGGLL